MNNIIQTTTITKEGIENFMALPDEWIVELSGTLLKVNPSRVIMSPTKERTVMWVLTDGRLEVTQTVKAFLEKNPILAPFLHKEVLCRLLTNQNTLRGIRGFSESPKVFQEWFKAEVQKQPEIFDKSPAAAFASMSNQCYPLVRRLFQQPKLVEKLNLDVVIELCYGGTFNAPTVEALKQFLKNPGNDKGLRSMILDYCKTLLWNDTDRQEFKNAVDMIHANFKIKENPPEFAIEETEIAKHLLNYLAGTIETPHAGLLFLSETRLQNFKDLYWTQGEPGKEIYTPPDPSNQGLTQQKPAPIRGIPVFIDLLSKIATTSGDPQIGDQYACFKFILDNYNPEDRGRFITGDPKLGFSIPANAFSGFHKLIQAIRAVRLSNPETEALLAQLSQKGEKPTRFFKAFLDELVRKDAAKEAIAAYLKDDRTYFEAKSSHTPPAIDSALKVSNYFEVGREGSARIALSAQDLMTGMIEGYFDPLKRIEALHIEKTIWIWPKEFEKEKSLLEELVKALEGLPKEIDAFNPEKLVAWASAKEFKPRTLLSWKEQSLEEIQQKIWDKLHIELIKKLCDPIKLRAYFESPEVKVRLEKAEISVDFSKQSVAELLDQMPGRLSITFDYIQGKLKAPKLEALAKEPAHQPTLALLCTQVQTELKTRVMQKMAELTGVEPKTFHLRIVPPSDPLHVTGKAPTIACDVPGDGKNSSYWLSTVCGAFVGMIQLKESTEAVVLVQSTVTVNKEGLAVLPKTLLKKGLSLKNPLHESLGDDFLKRWWELPVCICFDNVEGAKGRVESSLLNDTVITELYKTIGQALSEQFGGAAVLVGQGYSDYVKNLDWRPNTSAPLHFPIYTDAATVGTLIPEKTEAHRKYLDDQRQFCIQNKVADLTASLTYPVGWMQEEIYAETPHQEPIHEIQNNIMGAELANQVYGRTHLNHDLNLSAIAFDEDGIPAGYLLAYPATSEYQKEGVIKKGDPILYVHDIAVREKHRGTDIALNLLRNLMQKWLEIDLPILGDVRQSTSLPMLERLAGLKLIELIKLESQGEMTKVLIKKGTKLNRVGIGKTENR